MASIAKDSDVQSLGAGTSSRSDQAPIRVQPVALEVPVSVNGARTVDGSDKREPFSEATKTVLIFANGAVIRLTSTVAAGQLLFLTNENTKKEVVCQVVKSKNYRSVSGYVELEFTEPASGFWGMRFPSERPAQQKSPVAPAAAANPASPAAKNPPQASTPSASKPGASPAANANFQAPMSASSSDTDTEALKREAARLQEQLSGLLFAQNTGSNSPSRAEQSATQDAKSKVIEMAHRPGTSAPDTAVKASSLSAAAQKSSFDLAGGEVKIPAWLEPLARNASIPAPPGPVQETAYEVAAAPPVMPVIHEENDEETPVAHGEAVPVAAAGAFSTEPSHEFSSETSAPTFSSPSFLGEESGFSEPRSGSGKRILIGLLAAGVIAAAAGGAWYYGFRIPSSLGSRTDTHEFATLPPSERTSTTNTQQAQGISQPASVANTPLSAPANSSRPSENLRKTAEANPPAAVSAREVEKVPSNRVAPENSPSVSKTVEEPRKPSLGSVKLAAPTVGAKNVGADGVAAPHFGGGATASGEDALNPGLISSGSNQPSAPIEVGGDVKSARLLHSVPPTYPQLARSQRVSGDVRIDALVDATGHVTTMKIVAGPVLLHQAAMEALRQWRYQPATLDGKPVPMHLTVTVQFRLQ